MLITDNMPFGAYEFRKFAQNWGFKVETSSPRYPRSNGQAESAVKIAKSILKKECDLESALLNYRSTPISGIGLSPAQLLLNRKVKTKLTCLDSHLKVEKNNRDVRSKLVKKQEIAKAYYDSKCKERQEFKPGDVKKQEIAKAYYDSKCKERQEFKPGDKVTVREGNEWVNAEVIDKAKTPRSYYINNGHNVIRRNSHHLRHSLNTPKPTCIDNTEDSSNNEIERNMSSPQKVNSDSNVNNSSSNRPQRHIKLPQKYNDFIM
ncbi:hypothetical protein QE152_g26569 [Popillia japonica]|uniref:Integrase catalytic domain-containing protein n=1 Tax=Popillia japonica TaxID=7064 RepID=A0AAW1JXX8_POPJA